jgi:hypothetical protein
LRPANVPGGCADLWHAENADVFEINVDPAARVRPGHAYGAAPHLMRAALMRLVVALDPVAAREGLTPTAAAAVEEVCDEAIKDRLRVAAARVDRDRGIREAMDRARDCAEHGRRIKDAEDRLAALGAQLDATEAERKIWLGVMALAADLHPEVAPFGRRAQQAVARARRSAR